LDDAGRFRNHHRRDTYQPKQLEDFENKRVKIAGKVLYRHGVETGVQSYVEIMSIKADPGPDKP
jgi:hypothetical protein